MFQTFIPYIDWHGWNIGLKNAKKYFFRSTIK